MKYRNVASKGKKIVGEHNKYGSWMKFEANLSLFCVDLAIELYPNSLRSFMKLADGYGIPGYFPGGYDWSGIRDSSNQSIAKMHCLASEMLARTPEKVFAKMGLPPKLAPARAA